MRKRSVQHTAHTSFHRHSSSRFILITGGTRSGKSRFAVDLAKRFQVPVVYIATCQALDGEMKQRIARHRHERPSTWTTLECPPDLPKTLTQLDGQVGGVVLDCLTLYVSGLLVRGDADEAVLRNVRRLCDAIRRVRYPVLVVTNEVGWGVVPDHELGRRFRDLAGLANQLAASVADQVFLVVAGIPLPIKGEGAPALNCDEPIRRVRHSH